MKFLITGARGQLGREASLLFEAAGHNVFAADRQEMDITDQEQCEEVMAAFKPDVVVHCAAYTAVDAAESDVDGAYRLNAAGTRNVAVAAENNNAKIIYISTDYVFDGEGERPYREYDSPHPKSIYGDSKRAGEILVQTLSTRYFIVRTSWVYGKHGGNFVKTMLKLAREKPELRVVNDQKGSPTYTADLSRFLLELADTEKYGIYHASNTGACTWFEFAAAILDEARRLGAPATARLTPCTTEQFPSPAPRPQFSVLDHLAIRTNGLTDLRPWRDGLRDFMEELFEQP